MLPDWPGPAFPVASFIADELEARGWELSDLSSRFAPDPIAVLALDMLMCVHAKGALVGDEMAGQLGRALGVSPRFFVALDAAWQASECRCDCGCEPAALGEVTT